MNDKPWMVLLLGCTVACGGGQKGASAPEAESDGDVAVHRVPIGECREAPAGEGVKEVSASNAGWSYVAPTETAVQCAESKATLAVGPGLNIVFTSIAPADGGSVPANMTSLMVQKATEGVQAKTDAKVTEVKAGTFGERALSGHCGGARFASEGQQLRAMLCSAAAPGANGVVHFMFAAVTDTEAGFAEVGGTDAELFSQLVDGWTPTRGAP